MSNLSCPYNASNWYWKKADGTMFSSAKKDYVASDDEGFKSWSKSGGVPTPWPKDESGAESDTVMGTVLAPYGIALPKAS